MWAIKYQLPDDQPPLAFGLPPLRRDDDGFGHSAGALEELTLFLRIILPLEPLHWNSVAVTPLQPNKHGLFMSFWDLVIGSFHGLIRFDSL
jgi:hypothetical protein